MPGAWNATPLTARLRTQFLVRSAVPHRIECASLRSRAQALAAPLAATHGGTTLRAARHSATHCFGVRGQAAASAGRPDKNRMNLAIGATWSGAPARDEINCWPRSMPSSLYRSSLYLRSPRSRALSTPGEDTAEAGTAAFKTPIENMVVEDTAPPDIVFRGSVS